MARIVLLDSGLLGLAAMPFGKPAGDLCRAWLSRIEASGCSVLIPAVADYEVRRELIRVGLVASVRRLDSLKLSFNHLHVSEAAWDRAYELWAYLRNAGIPTAGPKDLDGDAILAG